MKPTMMSLNMLFKSPDRFPALVPTGEGPHFGVIKYDVSIVGSESSSLGASEPHQNDLYKIIFDESFPCWGGG